jgi:hypothetical protein
MLTSITASTATYIGGHTSHIHISVKVFMECHETDIQKAVSLEACANSKLLVATGYTQIEMVYIGNKPSIAWLNSWVLPISTTVQR